MSKNQISLWKSDDLSERLQKKTKQWLIREYQFLNALYRDALKRIEELENNKQ